MDWRRQAACLHKDPELFFPVGDAGPALAQIEGAKAVCQQCPVIDACLSWALETRQDTGVWGGRSESERRDLRRRVTRAPGGLSRRLQVAKAGTPGALPLHSSQRCW